MTEVEQTELTRQWAATWGSCPPDTPTLRELFRERWVRFHSLPESKRYPTDEAEYAIVLDRHNTILDELFAGQDVHVVTSDHDDRSEPGDRTPEHAQWHPDAGHWRSMCIDAEPGFASYRHLYVSRVRWQRGRIDPLLRAVADDRTTGVMILDTTLRRLYHPYDGGADILLAAPDELDALRTRHAAWLSDHPAGD